MGGETVTVGPGAVTVAVTAGAMADADAHEARALTMMTSAITAIRLTT